MRPSPDVEGPSSRALGRWDIVVGILGAFLGGWLAGLAGIAITNIVIEIIVAFVGALILLFIFRALTHRGVIHA